jgi:acyl-CoA reductase-like NAD-dependent aldehyde dehydrogenase
MAAPAAADGKAAEQAARGFGESGLGRELGAHALAAYTELKSVFVAS